MNVILTCTKLKSYPLDKESNNCYCSLNLHEIDYIKRKMNVNFVLVTISRWSCGHVVQWFSANVNVIHN